MLGRHYCEDMSMGNHFALTAKEAQRLKEAPDDEAVMSQVEEFEEAWDAWEASMEEREQGVGSEQGGQWGASAGPRSDESSQTDEGSYPWAVATGGAWDAIHRCLGNGTLAPIEGPLGFFTFSGACLCDQDYVVFLVKPSEAKAAAVAAKDVDQAVFRERFFKLDPIELEHPVSQEEFEFTWGQFQLLIRFYARASAAGRSVLFTVG